MNKTEKNFYHLITGEIVFKHDDEESINAIRMNGVLVDKKADIPIRLLGKAQQILQMNFHERMQDNKIKVIDVVLMNFHLLGLFTQEEFHKVPEGMKIQEKNEKAKDLDEVIAETKLVN